MNIKKVYGQLQIEKVQGFESVTEEFTKWKGSCI